MFIGHLLICLSIIEENALIRANNFTYFQTGEFKMRLLFKILILALGVFIGYQEPLKAQPKFEQAVRFNKKNGLPGNGIRDIKKGENGFIWIGTGEGLSRFDGSYFKNYRHDREDANSLIDNRVNTVLPTKDRIWVGTHLGVAYLDLNTDQFVNYQVDLTGKRDSIDLSNSSVIHYLFQDNRGDIWVGTSGYGTCRYDPDLDDFEFFNLDSSEIKANIKSTFGHLTNYRIIASRMNDSLIYSGTHGGLMELNIYTNKHRLFIFSRENKPLEKRLNTFRRIYQHYNGLIYYGSWGSGIQVLDPKSGKTSPLEVEIGQRELLKEITIVEIAEKSQNEIWISTSMYLFIYHVGRKELIVHKENKPRDGEYYVGVNCIDDRDRAWGKTGSGISLFDPMVQQYKHHSYADLNKATWGFAFYTLSHSDGNKITICPRNADGLFHFDKKAESWTKSPIPPAYQFYENNFSAVGFATDPDGNFTISSRMGLFTYLPKTDEFKPFPIQPDLPNNFPGEILWDASGNLWLCASTDGFFRINPKTKEIRNYKKELEPGDPPIAAYLISRLFEDSKNQIWVRRSDGISVYLPEKDSIINILYSLEPDKTFPFVHDIVEDGLNRIWFLGVEGEIGYADINHPERGIIHQMSLIDSLESPSLYNIAADTSGNIWGYGKKQVFKINAEDLSTAFYDLEYGADETDFYSFGFLDSGELIFGKRNGIILANEKDLKGNDELPQPYLTEIKILENILSGDSSVFFKKSLNLKHWENFFSLRFSAKSYTLGSQTKFRFRLKNFDNWTDAKDRRFADYTNVPSGDYVFQLQAANNEGIWNKETLEFPIFIATPWWATWWFRTLALLAIGFIAYSIYHYRIRQIREKARLKSEFEKKIANVEMTALLAQMNPHFLFNCLNSIDSYIIKNDSKKASEYLNNFARLIRLILQNSRSNYVSLKDELETLELYMQMEALRFRDKFKYEINIEEQINVPAIDIPPMLIQPYIENAIWHGLMHKKNKSEGKVQLSVSQKNGKLHFNIEDNGIGREKAKEIKLKRADRGKKSMGTQITQDRIDMINKLYNLNTSVQTYDLTNEKGEAIGTRVELIIPI